MSTNKKKSKTKKWTVLSPDKFGVERDAVYNSLEEATEALERFVKRYERQGYYSTMNRDRISLDVLKEYCEIKEL